MVYPLYFEQKKYLRVRYGLPPIRSSGVDRTPNQRLVFLSYCPRPWSCVLLLVRGFTPLPTLWPSVLLSWFSPLDFPFFYRRQKKRIYDAWRDSNPELSRYSLRPKPPPPQLHFSENSHPSPLPPPSQKTLCFSRHVFSRICYSQEGITRCEYHCTSFGLEFQNIQGNIGPQQLVEAHTSCFKYCRPDHVVPTFYTWYDTLTFSGVHSGNGSCEARIGSYAQINAFDVCSPLSIWDTTGISRQLNPEGEPFVV